MGFDPGATLSRHHIVRKPRRLRQERAITAAGEGDGDRGVDADLVPRRDEERLVPGPGPHRGADDLASIDERRVGAEDALGFCILADEPALGATNSRPLQEQPQVRRQPEPARMGVALAIEEENVRFDREIAAGGKHRGRLAE